MRFFSSDFFITLLLLVPKYMPRKIDFFWLTLHWFRALLWCQEHRWAITHECQWHRQSMYSLVSTALLSSDFAVSMTPTEPIRYQTYQILSLSDTKPIRYWTYQIPNLSDNKHIRYRTNQLPNLSDTECIRDLSEPINTKPIRYWTYQRPNSACLPVHIPRWPPAPSNPGQ